MARPLFVQSTVRKLYAFDERTLVNEPRDSHSPNNGKSTFGIRQQRKQISIFLRSNYDLLWGNSHSELFFHSIVVCSLLVSSNTCTRVSLCMCLSVAIHTSIRNNFHHHFCQGVRSPFFHDFYKYASHSTKAQKILIIIIAANCCVRTFFPLYFLFVLQFHWLAKMFYFASVWARAHVCVCVVWRKYAICCCLLFPLFIDHFCVCVLSEGMNSDEENWKITFHDSQRTDDRAIHSAPHTFSLSFSVTPYTSGNKFIEKFVTHLCPYTYERCEVRGDDFIGPDWIDNRLNYFWFSILFRARSNNRNINENPNK